MIDILFTIGQVAAAMLMVYGGMLTIGTVMSLQHKAGSMEDEAVLFHHLQHDA